jgi:hypothetical protein
MTPARVAWLLTVLSLVILDKVEAQWPSDELNQQWEALMVKGQFGFFEDGRRASFSPYASFEAVDGWVTQVTKTREAIIVEDKDYRTVEGGLLRRVPAGGTAVVELYGRQLPYPLTVVRTGWGRAHDFFLVFRPSSQSMARVLKQWRIPFDGPGRLFLRGFLVYDDARAIATVRVMDGVDHVAVDEGVPLPLTPR